ncbi:cytosol aminopeptidase-like isoform X2 [Chelonus insularis]|uniref:cytosol aminopeptidase-like isoform X2 n=1 Tax=Chelonus insularis TaxID=460826 RepID=UPI001588A352|nr:cytosol aminopeptidase-like isoform X2 [Chelonus insularis]
MALFLIGSRVVRFGNSQLRFYSSCLNMKKGLVLGVYEGENKDEVILTPTAAKYNEIVNGKLLTNINLAGPKIKKSKTRVFWGIENAQHACIAVVGLGKQNLGVDPLEEIDEGKENIRSAVAAGCSALDSVDVKDIDVEAMGNAEAAAEGAVLGTWFFQEFKNPSKQKVLPKVQLYGEEQSAWQVGKIKAEAQNWARRLGDTPANLMTPTIFSETVSNVLGGLGVKVIVHDKAWAEEKKMGSFLSVSRGSVEEPKFVEIHYQGGNPQDAPIAFVGKGVTFDAGGISLKPATHMDEMRADMNGAACVVASIKAAAELKLKVNIVGLIPLTENLPSGSATKPGDLVTAMNGKTIIVDNTDAEGRLILADALCYAAEFKPKFTLDIATLTGAMGIALGAAATGVFSSSTELWEVLRAAGTATGDRVWRMPLWQHYNGKMTKPTKSADVNNVSKVKGGGACVAAGFLREFASTEAPWLHLDIAGVMSSNNDDLNYLQPGMSGRPTRTLIEFLQKMSS